MLRKFFALAVAAALLAGCAATDESVLQAMPLSNVKTVAPTPDQAKAVAGFGERLFTEVRKGETNPVISPLSVFYALGMADDGASGSTAAAFEKTLGLTAEQARAVAGYLLADLAQPGKGTTLNAANSAWLDDQLSVKQDWVDRLKAYYQADAVRTDLQAGSAKDQVNQWISKKTNGLIPQMLAEPLDPASVALLINALYLKADWADQFSTDDTSERVFQPASGGDVRVPFVENEYAQASLIDTDSAKGVVLPYADGRLAFVAAMPTEGQQLALNGDTIASLLAAVRDCDNLVLSMPKFDTQYGANLVPALTAIGLGTAFDPGAADFSGISDVSLYITQVLHKVSMSVGEKGTEAAAATVVVMAPTSAQIPQSTTYLTFDRPYVYAVVDLTTGVPLFLGAMDDPSKAPPKAK